MPVQYSYTSIPLWAVWPVQSLSVCTVQLYLYSPYGPYDLYRASVPLQYSYTSIPLWAVWPVQILSACTRVHYLFHSPELCSYFPVFFSFEQLNRGGFGGLEVACWPLVPKFAGSNPAEAVGLLGQKNPQNAFLRRGSKAVGPMS